MRTMNKIVALALVLAMALSMMASAASFKDQEAINEDLIDEINMMLALNVYSEQGTGAGYFEPNGTITRAQAAKIIYVLKNKGIDNGATSWTGLNIFADVEAGAWYEGYVNYCASTGIIAGVGDNKFDPNAELTGVQLAKMLLVVIGYKADVEGYTGANWDANILADAEEAGFFVDYELSVKGIVTREWAAKMIVNAIYATKVKYEDGVAMEMYDVYNTPITYAEQNLGIEKAYGMLVATNDISLTTAANNTDGKTVTSAIAVISGDRTTEAATFNFDADPALLGQKVMVLYKGAALNTEAKVYGVTAHGDVTVAETTIDAISISAISNDTTNVNVKINGVTKKLAASEAIDVYVDYDAKTSDVYADSTNGSSVTGKVAFDGITAGSNDNRAVKFIDNNADGIYEVAFVQSVEYGEVKKLNAAKNILKVDLATDIDFDSEEEFKTVVFADEIAEEDIVKVTYDYSTGKELIVLNKVASVVGKVEKINKNSSGTVTSYVIAGNTYKTAAEAMSFSAIETTTTSNATYYVDGNYVVYTAAIANKADQTNIVVLLDHVQAANNFESDKIKVLKADGTQVVFNYYDDSTSNKYNDVAIDSLNNEDAYELVMVGEEAYLKALTTTVDGNNVIWEGTTSGITYTDSTAKIALESDTYVYHGTGSAPSLKTEFLVADDAFFFLKKANGTWAVVKASELSSDMSGTVGHFAVSAKGVPTMKYAVVTLGDNNLPTSTSTDKQFGILASTYTTYTDANDNAVTEIAITNLDGTTATLIFKNADFSNSDVKNLVAYKVTNGYATCESAGFTSSNLTAVSGKTLYIGGVMKTAADDMKIYTIDSTSSALKVVEGNEIILRDADLTTGNNILYSVNTSGKVNVMIVEMDGAAINSSLVK